MDEDGESGISGASGGSLASFALAKDFWRSLMDLEYVDFGIGSAMEAVVWAGRSECRCRDGRSGISVLLVLVSMP